MTYTQAPAVCEKNTFHLFHITRPVEKLSFHLNGNIMSSVVFFINVSRSKKFILKSSKAQLMFMVFYWYITASLFIIITCVTYNNCWLENLHVTEEYSKLLRVSYS